MAPTYSSFENDNWIELYVLSEEQRLRFSVVIAFEVVIKPFCGATYYRLSLLSHGALSQVVIPTPVYVKFEIVCLSKEKFPFMSRPKNGHFMQVACEEMGLAA